MSELIPPSCFRKKAGGINSPKPRRWRGGLIKMIVKAEGKYLRISPTKVRRVIDLLRGKDAAIARSILLNLRARPRDYLKKILESAIANAKVKGFRPEQLYVSKIVCDGGPTWKRYKATAFGRATLIRRRTSHIRIELELK